MFAQKLTPPIPSEDIRQEAKKAFGFDLKNEQLDIVTKIEERQDCILIAGTGWGKTLIYFFPLILWPKTTILIVTPLKVLGDEQVEKLTSLGINSIHLKSEMFIPIQSLIEGRYKAIFVSPEILFASNALSTLWMDQCWKRRLLAAVVDEAHCIGTWGGKFRTDYEKLGYLRSFVDRGTCFVAVSATLPPQLLSNVKIVMRFKDPYVVKVESLITHGIDYQILHILDQ
ncbi:P-loop containing nucleoside triphosphate hydrolase protein [Lobosporangium transversale]|uniref:DNA 3'-5' helicase n=1 Tax=Lobosporangium transversale TaxID=64571 RepID=A0A1Y2GMI4_9FUNG|nr:P-loop containing nucleoside triphosphate hydrolase protein [Lobosporangium transversale]ORZ15516.1 P-loop containing nucleoside triphosphate hydrolase protein [Lobosporangium transversale]|eukprot:XP_021881264.1 P-loop containing nucleoside triphosphate hydrolase protein [Lobosporangium transversale]